MLKDWIWMRVLAWFLVSVLGLGVTAGCASKGMVDYASIGTVKHPLLKLTATWEAAVECGPFEKFLDAFDAMWKAKLPTPVIDAAGAKMIADEIAKRGG